MTPNDSPASTQSPTKSKANDWLPEGYVVALDPEDREYIVPEFMVPALHQAYAGYRHKKNLNAFGAPGSVSGILFSITYLGLAKCRL